MEKIQFAVSAKTARLIGRENISDVEGAVIELIKNAYDADANCVFVQFRIPFPSVPKTISFELAASVFGHEDLEDLLNYYNNDGKRFVIREAELEEKVREFLFQYNTIAVLDNGTGMTEETLRTAWMNIGTNDKEERKESPGGRIKTGAKGIGRFALDKLSKATTVYTKSSTDPLVRWKINWDQFETAVMLDEVSAEIEFVEDAFSDVAQRETLNRTINYSKYTWDTGTIILLNPIREKWSSFSYERLNRNLKSIFPDTDQSDFDIYVDNTFSPSYSFVNERFSLSEGDYDYKISGLYDGKDLIKLTIDRKEIDTRKKKVSINEREQKIECSLKDFWSREAFQKEGYKRQDYAKQFEMEIPVSDLNKNETGAFYSVGPFRADFYFLKNTNSTNEIVKPILMTRRKDVINNYSGIKLYRDGFKVRPYGEEGALFDWINLGERARKSPAGVATEGTWRVRTNQIIGAVRISKDQNPNLVDMANREGLAVNDAYIAFVSIIEKMIEAFENDRQYIFREYTNWTNAKKREWSKTPEIVDRIKKKEKPDSAPYNNTSPDENEKEKYGNGYTKQDYERAVLELDNERLRKERALKTMMLYSATGVMTSTFSHEINRIMSNAGSRMQQLRHTVNRLVGPGGYQGSSVFDPFIIIDQSEKIDKLLENWLAVIMSAADQSAFPKKQINLFNAINSIIASWEPLLQQKLISVEPIILHGDENNCVCNIAAVDLHVIINNFMLNSAWFLEQVTLEQRIINVTIEEMPNLIVLVLENNGPPLDKKYHNNPDIIFNPGESTKVSKNGEGTGLGLWITKIVVDEASGEIHALNKSDGFGLRITIPK